MPSVLFYVQHLVGIGHLMRSRLVAEALARAGFDVHLVSGGMPVAAARSAEFHTHQLPPLRVDDGDFGVLRDDGGDPIDDAYRSDRRDRLLSILASVRPAVLICETFPFGRRALRFELMPLIESAAALPARPRIVASIRDILQRRTPERSREMLETANRWFDAILVHGDPRFIRLDATFPLAEELEPVVHHTGFVAARVPAAWADDECGADTPPDERGEIIVSAGGGAVGTELLAATLAARAHSRVADARWRLLAGPNLGEDAFQRLRAEAPAAVVVERARPDFAALLRRARASVSQAGYNTVLDVVRSGARPVLVPYVDHGETEQRMRALRLAELDLAIVVDQARPSPAALAAAIDTAVTRTDWGRWDFDDDGAARSAAIVSAMVER